MRRRPCSRNFLQLLCFRAAEGLGESFYFPASMSMLADYHGPRTRSQAMGIHQTSVYLGTAGGWTLGGALGALCRLAGAVLGPRPRGPGLRADARRDPGGTGPRQGRRRANDRSRPPRRRRGLSRDRPASLLHLEDRGDRAKPGGGDAAGRVRRGELRGGHVPLLAAVAGAAGFRPGSGQFRADLDRLAVGERPGAALRGLAGRPGGPAYGRRPDPHPVPGPDPGGAVRPAHRLVDVRGRLLMVGPAGCRLLQGHLRRQHLRRALRRRAGRRPRDGGRPDEHRRLERRTGRRRSPSDSPPSGSAWELLSPRRPSSTSSWPCWPSSRPRAADDRDPLQTSPDPP